MRILVENLKFKTVIGILDFEREKEQEICVNAKFEADEFIDYAEICKDICGIFKKRKFRLVEDALNFFDDYYRVKFESLKYFYMKILKTEILPNAKVGAEIEKNY